MQLYKKWEGATERTYQFPEKEKKVLQGPNGNESICSLWDTPESHMLFNSQFVHAPGSSLQQDVGQLYIIITQVNR